MNVEELIKELKKMPKKKDVHFFNKNNERLYLLDEGTWNIKDTKENGILYKGWVEITGDMV